MLSWIDQVIYILYFILVGGYGYYIYKKKTSSGSLSHDFFLAEGSLTWWAIGASVIASNISAEQFIGMSGSGFALGLAIASYEWMAAIGLILVAAFFLPVYLKNKIYTMPEFLRKRFDGRVSMIMAVFWVLVYVFVNLTSILYLGGLAIHAVANVPFVWCIWGLGTLGAVIALGGMKVIGYTDVIQVVLLIIGGLTTTYVALSMVAESGGEQGWMQGLSLLMEEVPSHFHMYIGEGQLTKPDGGDAYLDLPGWSVIIGGMWIMNLSYWGCNQYITQRALGAKNLETAQQGMLFAAFLKLLMPLIVVLPGIAAFYLHQNGHSLFLSGMEESGVVKSDKAYPLLLSILPTGFKGMAFAALTAAIVASLAGKVNSIATIVSLDIVKNAKKGAISEIALVKWGKATVMLSLIVAMLLAPLLSNLDQGFQFIQEFTGFITPGVLAIFLLGILTSWTTSNAAVAGAFSTFFYSILFKNIWLDHLPFMNRILIVFICTVFTMILVSFLDRKNAKSSSPIILEKQMFVVSDLFKVLSLILLGILTALYIVFW